MKELNFFAVYSLMMLVGSVFCIGFYIITKAEKGISPDGQTEYYGKIFKFWGQFLLREKKLSKITHFKGRQLFKKAQELGRTNPKLRGAFTLSPTAGYLYIRDGLTITPEDIDVIETANRCRAAIFKENGSDRDTLCLYEEEPNYVLPEILRMPFGQCPPCMSSFFGSLFYWFVYITQQHLFSWSQRPHLAAIGFWVIYCISLSCLNVVFYKKTH